MNIGVRNPNRHHGCGVRGYQIAAGNKEKQHQYYRDQSIAHHFTTQYRFIKKDLCNLHRSFSFCCGLSPAVDKPDQPIVVYMKERNNLLSFFHLLFWGEA
jgi:hypothetical protein